MSSFVIDGKRTEAYASGTDEPGSAITIVVGNAIAHVYMMKHVVAASYAAGDDYGNWVRFYFVSNPTECGLYLEFQDKKLGTDVIREVNSFLRK
jgi:hypothetical protein